MERERENRGMGFRSREKRIFLVTSSPAVATTSPTSFQSNLLRKWGQNFYFYWYRCNWTQTILNDSCFSISKKVLPLLPLKILKSIWSNYWPIKKRTGLIFQPWSLTGREKARVSCPHSSLNIQCRKTSHNSTLSILHLQQQHEIEASTAKCNWLTVKARDREHK